MSETLVISKKAAPAVVSLSASAAQRLNALSAIEGHDRDRKSVV